jgi:hypothetical protein
MRQVVKLKEEQLGEALFLCLIYWVFFLKCETILKVGMSNSKVDARLQVALFVSMKGGILSMNKNREKK